MHGPLTSGPSPVVQSTSVASSLQPFEPLLRRAVAHRSSCSVSASVDEMLGRVVTVRAERTADVFAVHHDLAERDVRGPGRLAVAHDDRVEPLFTSAGLPPL